MASNSYKMKTRLLLQSQIENAMKVTRSNRAAAEYLRVTYATYRKFAQLYKDSNGNLEKVDNHPYLSLIKDYPNPYMTGETLRQTAQNHLLVYGNCYIKIARNNAGRPAELYLIHPNNIQKEIS